MEDLSRILVKNQKEWVPMYFYRRFGLLIRIDQSQVSVGLWQVMDGLDGIRRVHTGNPKKHLTKLIIMNH